MRVGITSPPSPAAAVCSRWRRFQLRPFSELFLLLILCFLKLNLLLLQLFSLLRRLRPLQLPVLGQQLLAVVVQRLKVRYEGVQVKT